MSVDEIPAGKEWQYEPKWDGFRCLVFRDGNTVELQSKSGKPLTRYFPEMVEAVRALKAKTLRARRRDRRARTARRFPSTRCCSAFIRPQAASQKLATETPALLIVFDLLVDGDGTSLIDEPLHRAPEAARSLRRKYFAKADASGCRPPPPSSPTRRNG